ncbi:alpha/beta fold hydrolase [Vibrio litoralis]|uniref:alpha/beta fold hydrolase n=1 Tax=Vibrio litoralis TaxID=335972 RepID=UPI00041D5857|nr:alpha/beta fold hydrolase [Vibrio litoralis]
MNSPQLNHTIQGQGPAILLIHGLFGSLSNLGLLARDLVQDHTVISVDLRNHGHSFHSDTMNYSVMADDLNQLLVDLNISSAIVIGHSMGGKAAMALCNIAADKISKLIVLDMAPIAYQQRRHDNVFSGLKAVINEKPKSRKRALDCLSQHIEIDGVRQFLAKSLHNKDGYLQWLFNVEGIINSYQNIQDWADISPFNGETLFLKGADSDYLMPEHQAAIQKQFPNSKAHIIANTGHWLHAEKPIEVLRSIRRFIKK